MTNQALEPTSDKQISRRNDYIWAGSITTVSLFVLLYRVLSGVHLDRSIAMFVGVPMAIGVFAATLRADGAIGRAMKYLTLCLCLISPLLGEGAICIVTAMPIAYPVAALTAWGATRKPKLRAMVVLPFAFALLHQRSVEELPQVELSDSVQLNLDPQQTWRAVADLTLPLDEEVPLFLRLGFPSPQKLIGQGASVGSLRKVMFDRGTVVARVVAADAPRWFRVELSYENVGHEFFDRWVLLEDATFTFAPLPEGGTRLTHTTHYRRLLEPALYFGPLERFGVQVMERHLLARFKRAIETSAVARR